MNLLDAVFSWFLAATLRGALLALAVLALQGALRGRLPARWRYRLWLPVIVVLFAPDLPQSRWSAENHIASTVAAWARALPARIKQTDQPLAASTYVFEANLLPQGEPLDPLSRAAPLAPSASAGWRVTAGIGWFTGVVGLLAFSLAAYVRTLRRMARGAVPPNATLQALLAEAAYASGLRRVPRLLLSTAIPSPAITGLVRATLLLPANFPGRFTPEEARLVLLHELMHLRRHDLPLNWLLCLLQALHWCNPILWLAFHRMRADREAACDAQVLASTVRDCRADYGHALLKIEGTLAPSVMGLGFVGIFERAAGMRARISAIAAYRRVHPLWAVLGVALIAALLVAGATRAQDAPPAKVPPNAAAGAEEAAVQNKLNTIIIPRLEFRDATAREAFDFLRAKSVELDATEPDPARRGVNIVLNLNAPLGATPDATAAQINPADALITVALRNIPLIEAFKYVSSLANLKFRIEPHGIEVVPLSARDPLLTKAWKVDPVAWTEDGNNFRGLLEASGVTFPAGATAALSADKRRLVMRNSQENLDLVDALVAAASPPPNALSPRAAEPPTASIQRKLNGIIIPRLEFRDATVHEAVAFLKKKSVDLDTAEPDRAKRGVNIVLNLDARLTPVPTVSPIPGLDSAPPPSPSTANPADARITVSLSNIPLLEALKYVTALANLKFKIEPHAVSILPQGAATDTLITKEWRLTEAMASALGLGSVRDAKIALTARGVAFPKGATATWLSLPKSLIMRNTQENLDLVDALLGAP